MVRLVQHESDYLKNYQTAIVTSFIWATSLLAKDRPQTGQRPPSASSSTSSCIFDVTKE